MVTACVVLLYASYSIPVVCLLLMGRSKLKRGPFWMGKAGMACNIVLLIWLVFCTVMYSFPPQYPVEGDNMNYVCVVYAVTFAVLISWWYASARVSYHPIASAQ
ncbi:hypothetical protein RAB80_000118 [Fusarium oxysporum f. sp. vasinfectum]|nr:hypothetical protein RAB80_000118 [Fusarium oxysporum f. sp. vasinfectum]